jgi:hypothetical protein
MAYQIADKLQCPSMRVTVTSPSTFFRIPFTIGKVRCPYIGSDPSVTGPLLVRGGGGVRGTEKSGVWLTWGYDLSSLIISNDQGPREGG